MTITVKKLISELDKIENKFLEVEVYTLEKKKIMQSVYGVRKADKKVLILTDEVK